MNKHDARHDALSMTMRWLAKRVTDSPAAEKNPSSSSSFIGSLGFMLAISVLETSSRLHFLSACAPKRIKSCFGKPSMHDNGHAHQQIYCSAGKPEGDPSDVQCPPTLVSSELPRKVQRVSSCQVVQSVGLTFETWLAVGTLLGGEPTLVQRGTAC